ncbi:trace amine-associated receptor 4-like [Lethenteron reissneri]|uniref:trace amine-associated receptor 4-like n=1 Tax=Lethenteron reissneri TaxID=7753 RepID=UPI002AB73CED|nr:trace amine-associated receptor 4-like [Lethenteron reissneri]
MNSSLALGLMDGDPGHNASHVEPLLCLIRESGLRCRPARLSARTANIIFIAMIFSMVLNFLGNMTIITAISYFKQLQVLPNTFTFSLAVADIMVGVVVMPFYMTQCVYDCWFYSHAFCKVHHFLDAFISTASTMHLCCIAYDRYLAICDPMHYRERFTWKTAALLLAAAWLGSLLYVVPVMLGWIVIGIEDMMASRTCPDNCVFYMNKVFSSCGAFFSFVVPMTIMTLAYVKIYRVARKQARSISVQQQGSQGKSGFNKQQWAAMKREHNATKTVSIILGVFMFCWAPFFSTIVNDPWIDFKTNSIFWDIVNWFGHVNSAINPYLYGGFNRTFRNAIRIMFSRKFWQPGSRSAEL